TRIGGAKQAGGRSKTGAAPADRARPVGSEASFAVASRGAARSGPATGGRPFRTLGGSVIQMKEAQMVKSVIWAVSLGSGTSGGVLLPLLLRGGALGGREAAFLPHEGGGFWPLVSMAAIRGGPMRSPFTAVIFALELTHDINMMLPLMLAVTVA